MKETLENLKSRLQIFFGGNISLLPFDELPNHLVKALPFTKSILNPEFSTEKRIDLIWSPALDQGKRISNLIKQACEDLLLIYMPDIPSPIRICYLYRQSHDMHCLVGNPPVTIETGDKNSIMRTYVPETFMSFLKIHNGLSVNGNGAIGLFPRNDINLISKHPDYQIDDIRQYSISNALLLFSGNGTGDLQCFDLTQPVGNDFLTVLWDHETREIYNPENFWDYFERFIKSELNM